MLGSADVYLITYHIYTNDYGKMAAFSSTKAVKCVSFSVLRSFYFPCSQTESWDKIFPLFFCFLPYCIVYFNISICHHLQISKRRGTLFVLFTFIFLKQSLTV